MIHKKAPGIANPPPSSTTEVVAIRLNDEKTIKNIYMANYLAAEKYILLNNGSPEEAKDIYQEAFIAVWRNIKMEKFFPENENSLKHYLLQIVKHKWLDHLRSARHRNTLTLQEENFENEADPVSQEQHEKISLIKQHFEKLGQVCKEILRRFYYNKESLKVISQAFNWTEATARNNKYRCIERLRESLHKK